MKKILCLAVMCFAAARLSPLYPYEVRGQWEDMSSGIDETGLTVICIDGNDPNVLFAGSSKSIFKSADRGKTWQKVYMVRGTRTAVNDVLVDPVNSSVVYACTQNGLLKSTDAGVTWNKVFEGAGEQERDIRRLFIDRALPTRIYIGTGRGLYVTDDSTRTRTKVRGEISGACVNFLAGGSPESGAIYAASSVGIFKSADGGQSWKRVFVAPAQAAEPAEETADDTAADETETASNRVPTSLAFDSTDPHTVYAGTNAGVFVSLDGADTWDKLTTSGLTNNAITSLIVTADNTLYASTAGGVFALPKPYACWQEIAGGIPSKDIRCLAYDVKNNCVLAASEKGIYAISLLAAAGSENDSEDAQLRKLLGRFDGEPNVHEIQDAAIRYAEVNKEKIEQWRKGAKQKAILPTLSVGVDHDSHTTSEIYTSATRSFWTTGPDDMSTGWDVRVSWDLGDLIWNDDQTSIDVRSRLMVQLRDDILDEVTRLYFERRKVQIDLVTNPPKNLQVRLVKELKLQELTAGIDALTGGWFSKRLTQIS